MNYIDLFILVLLVLAVFRGFTHGFIMQLTQLVALVIGIFAALKLSGFTARQLENRISINTEYLYLLSLGITFILVFIGIYFAGKLIEKLAETAQLSFANRMLGILFSLCKTILLLGVFLAFVDRIDRHTHLLPENTREQSIFYKPITSIIKSIFPLLAAPTFHEKQKEEFVRITPGMN